MNRLRSLIVLPLAAAAFLAAIARGQLTCETAQGVALGATPTANLPSFPGFQVQSPCNGAQTVHHAIFHRFTAPVDGWYSLHLVPTDATPWRPMLAVIASCSQAEADVASVERIGRPLCGQGLRPFAAATIRLSAGQSRLIVAGGSQFGEAGSAILQVNHVGSTLMANALPLSVGANTFTVPPLELALPHACDLSPTLASKFEFTPARSGTYRISLCGFSRDRIRFNTSPDLDDPDVPSSEGHCTVGGKRSVAQLTAGMTYYIVATTGGPFDGCYSKTAYVEYVDPCPADFNDDDFTDGIDLGILLAAWGTPARDITGDGTTDGVDLGILLAMWGSCPEG